MKLSQELLNNLIEITSNSAIACFPFIGKNEKILADKAATDVMRDQLNKLNIKGKVVIGEGELDEAPMLYIGEELGIGNGPEIECSNNTFMCNPEACSEVKPTPNFPITFNFGR